MKADSQERTGRSAIEDISREALLDCIHTEDVKESYTTLMDLIRNGDNSEKLSAIRLMWDYTVAKPKQSKDITSGGEVIKQVTFDIFSDDDKD